MTRPGSPDVLKPFLWMALLAFLAGLASYLAVGEGAGASGFARTVLAAHVVTDNATPELARSPIAPPPSSAEWNLPKKI